MATRQETLWMEKISLIVILFLSAFLRLWNLDHNGFGNPYYAAAVRSMLLNWHNFIYDSYDPVGFVTVDKPPVALWIQTLSAKLLGYNGFHLMLPQVLEGLTSVGLVYYLVRRRFDGLAALLAALAIGLGPICVAVDRYNNVDACLVTVLLFAAWAMSLAAEKASLRFLLVAMILVGIGFNVKMVVAFIVLPTFYFLYLIGADIPWKRRFRDLLISSIVLAVVALSWPLFIDLTPADQRPFVGSTQDNSMIGLSLGWNGFQRLLRGRRFQGRVPGVGNQPISMQRSTTVAANLSLDNSAQSVSATGHNDSNSLSPGLPNPNRRKSGNGMGSGNPGPLRLADKNMAGQILWFFPLALVGLIASWRRISWTWPMKAEHKTLFLWSGWFLTYALVFSFMRGAMHTYYIVMLAPPLAVLTGIGLRDLWLNFTEGKPFELFTGLLATAVWQSYIVFQYPDWRDILLPVLALGVVIALAGLWLAGHRLVQSKGSKLWGPMALILGLMALFCSPVVWCVSPVLASGNSVEANPDLLTGISRRGMGNWGNGLSQPEAIAKLMTFLKSKNYGKYLLVAPNSQSVSPIIIQTGEPVMALGGFMGGDPTMTMDEFAQKVKAGQIRYFLLSDFGRGGNRNGGNPWDQNNNSNTPQHNGNTNPGGWGGFGRGGNGFQQEIAKWVRENGKPVDPALWRVALRKEDESKRDTGNLGRLGGGRAMMLYDLAPQPN